MKTLFLTCILATLLITTPAFATSHVLEKSAYKGFPNTLKRDFFIIQSDQPNQHQNPLHQLSPSPDPCRDNIAKVVCLVEPAKEDSEPQVRPCLPASKTYAAPFENVYDAMPPTLQKMFCSLRRINIETKFFGTAYGAPLQDKFGNLDGAVMGFRQSVLDEHLNLTTWASWKEQLSFGGIYDTYTLTPGLPLVQSLELNHVNTFVYFVVAHEFGHIFDFSNRLNQLKSCKGDEYDPEAECEFMPGTFAQISWQNSRKPNAAHDFAGRESFCFYNCQGKFIDKSQVLGLYSRLAQTNFISSYASTWFGDDFAESFAYFLVNQNLATGYVFNTEQGDTYDILAKVRSPLWAEKFRYIDAFLKRTDIIYP